MPTTSCWTRIWRLLISPIVAAVVLICRLPIRAVRWLGGYDLDELRLAFHQKDAYTPLTWLAGFVISSGISFAVSVQGHGVQPTAIVIYVLVSLIMIGGMVHILRATFGQDDNRTRSFDEGCIRFARWIMFTSLLLCSIFVLLAFANLIPGQRRNRQYFAADEIQCQLEFAGNAYRGGSLTGLGEDQRTFDIATLDRWKDWLAKNREIDGTHRQMLYARQIQPFDADYDTFLAQIQFRFGFESPVEFVDALAFLVHDAAPDASYDPVYRLLETKDRGDPQLVQLRLPRDLDGKAFPVINVRHPNKGDFLLLFIRVKSTSPDVTLPQDPSAFRFSLRRAAS